MQTRMHLLNRDIVTIALIININFLHLPNLLHNFEENSKLKWTDCKWKKKPKKHPERKHVIVAEAAVSCLEKCPGDFRNHLVTSEKPFSRGKSCLPTFPDTVYWRGIGGGVVKKKKKAVTLPHSAGSFRCFSIKDLMLCSGRLVKRPSRCFFFFSPGPLRLRASVDTPVSQDEDHSEGLELILSSR